MSFIERILCPTDFSEGSKTACAYAIEMAEHLDASVTLVHVAPAPTPMYVMAGASFAPVADNAAIIMDSARQELEAWVESYQANTKVELALRLRQGEPYPFASDE